MVKVQRYPNSKVIMQAFILRSVLLTKTALAPIPALYIGLRKKTV